MVNSAVKWSRSIDFLFGCAGGAIGLGNVWRFPYVCFANGGGAFLIPYLFAATCIGLPLFFLESCLGQLTNGDVIKVWKLIPLFKGIGYAQVVISWFTNSYFNVILAWLARYLIASFHSVLPWTSCNNAWNTENCSSRMANATAGSASIDSNFTSTSPVQEFWENKVLQISKNIDNIGGINYELGVCLLVLWILVYFSIWRGVKWTSKIVYVTVPLPYVLLFIVLIRGMTLDGASLGVSYYLKPNVTALRDPEVWLRAIEQVCFSFAVGWGIIATLASHNLFNHNFYRDTVAIVCLNIFTSFLSGLVVFSVLGYMAKLQNVTVTSVAKSGPGLAFIAYPQALTFLPFPQLWSVLFFTMVLFLTFDSLFVGMECLTLSLFNQLPKHTRKRKWAYETFTAVVILAFFLLSIPMVTDGGYFMFRVFEFGGSGWCIIFITFFQAVAVGWLIGADRFLKYASMMLGRRPVFSVFLKLCWKFIIPLSALVLAGLSLKKNYAIYYADGTLFPPWALVLGWTMILSSLVWIPVGVILLYGSQKGTFAQKLKSLLQIDESACLFNQKQAQFWSTGKNKLGGDTDSISTKLYNAQT